MCQRPQAVEVRQRVVEVRQRVVGPLGVPALQVAPVVVQAAPWR